MLGDARKEALSRSLEGIRKRDQKSPEKRDLKQATAYLTREPRKAEREAAR